MNDETQGPLIGADQAYLKSLFYEQLVEHVFVSQVLQEAWYRFGQTVEVLRSEVDSAGHDVVFECNGILRYVQLKTSKADAETRGQKVNLALASKPGGCIVWLIRHEDGLSFRVRLTYLFFGGKPGQNLPSLKGFEVARHTKANAQGKKAERPAIRVVPRKCFEVINSTKDLVECLFGLRDPVGMETARPRAPLTTT